MNGLMLFSTVSEVSILIPALIILFKRKYLSAELRILAVYVILTLIRNTFGVTSDLLYYSGLKNFNTLFFYNWQSVLGFYLIVWFYYRLLHYKYWRLFIISASFIFTICAILEIPSGSLTKLNTGSFNQYTYTASSLIILVIVLAYFYELLQDLKVENITKFSYFWVSVGLLFYFGGSLFVNLFLVKAAISTTQITWGINSALSFVFHFTVSLAFYYSNFLYNSHKDE
ncbi:MULTISPECIES: hypothetical protein [Emticicia]|uniref:hypothetical protein n=1 Tax=Emticicia TaxID=312278 RepID=UPI0020A03BF6|nr:MULTISPECIES: hypothetical protein [Emticicia]UTA69581.1 hypothetical protein MB380_07155 [Emticicia sp. 21SJ11W-3]